ncbi:MAG: penicillin-binding protein activator [Acetobacteraceae bacterium]|nr:penicillin-binding protein activator [Acetobacteraceae bacterium]
MWTRRLLLAATAAAPGLATALPALAQTRTIAIGFMLPASGEFSQYGERFRNSATMALDAFRAANKLPGANVIIKYEDTRADPRESVNIARKFVDDREIVGVLGDFSSSASMAAAQVFKEAGMAQLSPTASHPDFVKMSPWQFRNITTQAQEGPLLATWMVENGLKRVAVICIQNDWGQSVAAYFNAKLQQLGGTTITTEFFNPGTRDFRAILTKIARERPDGVYLGMFYEDGAALLQQRRQLGMRMPFYGTGSLYEPRLIELAGREAVEGLRISTAFAADSDEPVVRAFVEEYTRRYGSAPNMFSAVAFDATSIMLAAIARAGINVTRTQLRDELARTKDFPGATGLTTFDPETREPNKAIARMEVRNGSFVVVR